MVKRSEKKTASPESEARRFIRTGKSGALTIAQLAVQCNKLVRAEAEKSSLSALKLGRQFIERARRVDRDMLAVALRAYGWAAVVAGKYEEAEKAYLEARPIVARSQIDRAKIDRILIDIYMYRGDYRQAKRRAKMALSVFEKLDARAEIAKTEVNYANLLHRLDRHKEAREFYHRSAEFFADQGAELAAAICWYNEANTFVQLFDLNNAERLYRKARTAFAKHNYELRAIGCLYGLAWLHMLQARFHIALKELAECERYYKKHRQHREYVLCLLDRAEVLLGLNLSVDARDAAREAERRAEKIGIRYESAKAAFFLGKALLGLGRTLAAHNAFARSRKRFKQEGNLGFSTAVEFYDSLRLQSDEKLFARLRDLRRRIPGGQLPLWEAMCDLELLSDIKQSSESVKRLTGNRAVVAVPQIRARYLTRIGDLEEASGRRKSALQHWSQAASILSSIRADLPPVDMRSSFAQKHSGPYARLIEATCEKQPLVAGVWLDRFCTAGIWSPTQTSTEKREVHRSLAELAGVVSSLSTEIDHGSGQRRNNAVEVTSSQRLLERRIRDELSGLSIRRRTVHGNNDDISQQIKEASRRGPVVQFHLDEGELFAIIHENKSSRSHRYANGRATLERFVNQWRFLIERMPHSNKNEQRQNRADEAAFLNRLSEWLLGPIELTTDKKRLLLVINGQAASLPWAALRVNNEFLVDSRPLVFAPSIQHYTEASRARVNSKRTEIFVGDTQGLTSYESEFEPLLNNKRRRLEIHDPCRRDDWPENSRADIWHYTGHARLRTDNPFYSSLLLSDGPIFAADFRLRKNRVNTVVLAACRTAARSLLSGDESSGFIRAFLEMGARNVIASHWAVNDESAATWSRSFYEALNRQPSVSQAVVEASRETRDCFPLAYDWAAFSMNGAG